MQSYLEQESGVTKKGRTHRFAILLLAALFLAAAVWAIWLLNTYHPTLTKPAGVTSPDTKPGIQPDTGTLPGQPVQDNEPWQLLLINRDNPLPESYAPELAELPGGEYVDVRIYSALMAMFDAAERDGVAPVVVSGYRTFEKQQEYYDRKIRLFEETGMTPDRAIAEAERWVAIPGTSEHHSGLAVDINSDVTRTSLNKVYAWLEKNAPAYGFIRRYRPEKEAITGVADEPWHYRYVGVAAAQEITESGVCLEEYIEAHK